MTLLRWALPAILAGSVLVAGVTIATREPDWDEGFRRSYDLAAPFAASPDNVAAGRAIFRERCQPCHGERGRGDGPLAAALQSKPADLVLHAPQHTEGELFYFISRGVPDSAMPAWKDALSETQRWQLVHYLDALAGGAPYSVD